MLIAELKAILADEEKLLKLFVTELLKLKNVLMMNDVQKLQRWIRND